MQLAKYLDQDQRRSVGVVENGQLRPMRRSDDGGQVLLTGLLEQEDPTAATHEWMDRDAPLIDLDSVRLLAPIDNQEVWGAGVTYLRSKVARQEES
ncbi:MAG TPA: 2-hydroxyhepta-2,4-diene-1,7-dioate isomerase, partial [Isosphaeraceae bacterium]|nr:2-hydroxyhepta-2,4-diene-1,7-dioate isomerase [Isosphaeraceae bacterium]